MESLGYEYRGEYGIPGRHYFVKGDPRTHHVHMLEVGGETWGSMTAFRDALLACPDVAQEYADVKLRIAAAHSDNRTAYQRAKDQVIERVLEGVSALGKPIDRVIAYILSRRALQGASFTSPYEVRAAIDRFIAAHNKNAHPFEWTKADVKQRPLSKSYAYL